MPRVSDAAGDVTVLLERVREGEPGAADELFGQLYGELKRIAGSLFRSQRSEHEHRRQGAELRIGFSHDRSDQVDDRTGTVAHR